MLSTAFIFIKYYLIQPTQIYLLNDCFQTVCRDITSHPLVCLKNEISVLSTNSGDFVPVTVLQNEQLEKAKNVKKGAEELLSSAPL